MWPSRRKEGIRTRELAFRVPAAPPTLAEHYSVERRKPHRASRAHGLPCSLSIRGAFAERGPALKDRRGRLVRIVSAPSRSFRSTGAERLNE